jgi:TonB family protein
VNVPCASWSDRVRRNSARIAALAVAGVTLAATPAPTHGQSHRDQQIPRLLAHRPPVYPEHLRRSRTEGFADIDFHVDQRGLVTEARVHRASHPEFGEAALAAVRSWQFEPGRRDGVEVSFWLRIPMVFRVEREHALERWAGREIFRQLESDPVAAESLTDWPQPARWVDPPYPRELRGSGIRGEVIVSFVVDVDGAVVNPEILKTTHQAFIVPALASIIVLRFAPQLDASGQPVPVRMTVRLRFDERRQRAEERAASRRSRSSG